MRDPWWEPELCRCPIHSISRAPALAPDGTARWAREHGTLLTCQWTSERLDRLAGKLSALLKLGLRLGALEGGGDIQLRDVLSHPCLCADTALRIMMDTLEDQMEALED